MSGKNELPAVDVVSVIRCKDCKWWDDSPLSTVAPQYHRCKIFRKDTLPYFFCGYAERGTDAE